MIGRPSIKTSPHVLAHVNRSVNPAGTEPFQTNVWDILSSRAMAHILRTHLRKARNFLQRIQCIPDLHIFVLHPCTCHGDDVVFIMWDCNPTPTIIPLTDYSRKRIKSLILIAAHPLHAVFHFPRALTHAPFNVLHHDLHFTLHRALPLVSFPSNFARIHGASTWFLARMQGRSVVFVCHVTLPVVAFVVSLLPSVSPFWPEPFVREVASKMPGEPQQGTLRLTLSSRPEQCGQHAGRGTTRCVSLSQVPIGIR